NEMGIEHYQHPRRSEADFGPYLDNFSDWVIYTTLIALSVDKYLWTKVNVEDKHLLFTKTDFERPAESDTFKRLKNHANPQLRQLASSLENCISYGVAGVPELNPDIAVAPVASPQISISMPDASAIINRVQSLGAPLAEGLRKTGEIVGSAVKKSSEIQSSPPPP